MSMITVRAVSGRVAFDAPKGGARIPHDKYVTILETPWVRALLNKWHDIEREPVKAPQKAVAAPKAPASEEKPAAS